MVEQMPSDDAAWLARITGVLRSPEPLSPDFVTRVTRAANHVAAEWAPKPQQLRIEPGETRAASHAPPSRPWLIRPRAVHVSPLAGLAAAAVIAGIAALAGARFAIPGAIRSAPAPSLAAGSRSTADSSARDTLVTVRFMLVAPGAARVALVGDFNDWSLEATQLSPSGDGSVWSVSVLLPTGRHQYAFVVDDSRWMVDPRAPAAVEDDYGTRNSVITIPERAT